MAPVPENVLDSGLAVPTAANVLMYELLRTDQLSRTSCARSTRGSCSSSPTSCAPFLLESVSQTGGHLSSNLGTVELTIALHYVFDTPARPHRLGRRPPDLRPQGADRPAREDEPKLRMWQGISGFPRREESEYDTFGTAHSSTSISAALGMAVASQARGREAPRRGGDRRRRDDRRHGVRGAQQRRRDGRGSARHPERQRDVDLAAGGRAQQVSREADVGPVLRRGQARRASGCWASSRGAPRST